MLYSLLRRRYLWRHLSRKFFRVWSFLFLGGESFASSSLPRRRRPFSLFSFFSLLGGFNTKSLMQNLLLFLFFFFRVGEGTFGFCRRRGKERRLLNDTIIVRFIIRRYRLWFHRLLFLLSLLSFLINLVIFFLFFLPMMRHVSSRGWLYVLSQPQEDKYYRVLPSIKE